MPGGLPRLRGAHASRAGAARLELVTGARQLHPEDAMFDAMGVFGDFGYLTPPVHADLTLKQKALDRVQPAGSKPGRYRPPDAVLAFLDSL